ncbi:DUF7526 family protein [Natrinema ejinorense]|uniref:Uncharacterized protein n=1 Tax=Natrinema ejinorense TaxID=373386 RepID=A0A2A5QP45_9EURY|nr:hypothetical protein [Natrinema ejinorense]PCR88610.1 hypothetical protein CP557_21485 [Natrinema ejinorense]
MTDTTELQRSVIQVLPPSVHDDYALSEPMRALAEGKYIIVLEETADEKDGAIDRLRSLLGFTTLCPPPNVLLEGGTDDHGEPIHEGDILRVQGEETHLENIYDAVDATVMAREVEA